MRFICDRTGFPCISDGRVAFQLLPVTKTQFDIFLASVGESEVPSYEEMLALNPRNCDADINDNDRERLFVTGILFEEADRFAKWLHSTATIPTWKVWQRFATTISMIRIERDLLENLSSCQMCSAAKMILESLFDHAHPETLSDLALIRNGVLEWVSIDPRPGGLGAPRPEFLKNTYDPYNDRPIVYHHGERSRYFGFRAYFHVRAPQ